MEAQSYRTEDILFKAQRRVTTTPVPSIPRRSISASKSQQNSYAVVSNGGEPVKDETKPNLLIGNKGKALNSSYVTSSKKSEPEKDRDKDLVGTRDKDKEKEKKKLNDSMFNGNHAKGAGGMIDKFYSPKGDLANLNLNLNGRLIFKDSPSLDSSKSKPNAGEKDKEISLLSSKIQNDIHSELEGRNKSLPAASERKIPKFIKSPKFSKNPKLIAGFDSKLLKNISNYYQNKYLDNVYAVKAHE